MKLKSEITKKENPNKKKRKKKKIVSKENKFLKAQSILKLPFIRILMPKSCEKPKRITY